MSIKELRKKTGLSQSQFAKKFHMSVRTLQHWEQEDYPTPTFVLFMVEYILDLEERLNVNVKHSD